jgi:hypothetical protein
MSFCGERNGDKVQRVRENGIVYLGRCPVAYGVADERWPGVIPQNALAPSAP